MRALALVIATIAVASAANAASLAGVESPDRAHTNWMLHCQGCHLPDATGTKNGAPSMAHQVARFLEVPEGRSYLTRVPGVTNAALSDDQLAELLNWTLATFDSEHLPEGFRPFTAAEMAEGRRAPLVSEAAVLRAKLEEDLRKQDEASARDAD